MIYKISYEAQDDLEKIWLFTFENWSLQQADRYLNVLIEEFEYLTKSKNLWRSYDYMKKGYFISRVKSHIVFFKFNSKENQIEIIRVLHQRMDIESHL